LYTVLSWSKNTKVELPRFLQAYLERVAARPAVQLAMKSEGLIK
jgi:glutathione S-transferase